MTATLITVSLVKKLQPKERRYEIRDTELRGFMVRVSPNGFKTYAVQYKRGGRVTLGRYPALKLDKARDKAKKIIGDYAAGLDPQQAEAKARGVPTLNVLIKEKYEDWVKTHRAAGDEDVKTIKRHFGHLLNTPIDQIDVETVDSWRTEKLKNQEMKPNTINRTVTSLRSALNKAVEWKLLDSNGLSELTVLKYDDSRIRSFDQAERERFFEVLEARERRIKEERANANKWRISRGYDPYPEIKEGEYADHVYPMIILSLNTGMRKSEESKLLKRHVNLEKRTIFIAKSKNYLARYVPLNDTAIDMLKTWMRQTEHLNSPYLFPSPLKPNKPITTIKKAWMKVLEDAKIEDFRWHDMRHDFASSLVMEGVSLYAVQRLLGHKSLDQTMKYAHLAPDFIVDSVMKLDAKNLKNKPKKD